ncbi:uncharacterized protein LOC143863673 isoform X2 [Tasmannia lanceolata]|uniref:uncharacterized protein LOC143863673 isoform X2 n=1 Tax=Tasmannia lanceolata TaxID=3420 RepID=UPI004063BB7B
MIDGQSPRANYYSDLYDFYYRVNQLCKACKFSHEVDETEMGNWLNSWKGAAMYRKGVARRCKEKDVNYVNADASSTNLECYFLPWKLETSLTLQILIFHYS